MKRVIAIFLTCVFLLGLLPMSVLAAEPDKEGLCPHHQEHSYEVCGCIEAVEEIPCNMNCAEIGGDGQIIHVEGCAYTPAVAGRPCGYVCRICPVQAMLNALPDAESVTPDNRAWVEARLAAIDEARAELTDEETEQLNVSRYQAVVSALSALDGQAGANVPAPAAEQFDGTLFPGDTYWFNLSGENIPGEKNSSLPDDALHWVPFTYAGTINAYSRSSEGVSEGPNVVEYEHSLFIADYNVTHTVSWDDLDNKSMIFGKAYTSGGVGYTLRAPSAGSSSTGSGDDERGTPESNEWDKILDKDAAYIKNWSGMVSWGQDTSSSDAAYRSMRGAQSARFWAFNSAVTQGANLGFRPVLELPASAGVSIVTLNLNGGKIGSEAGPVYIVVKSGEDFTAPGGEGLTAPAGKVFSGWRSLGTTYAAGAAVPTGVSELTTVWAIAPNITTQPVNKAVSVSQTAEFTIQATGDPTPTCQWQVSKDSGTSWADISGATGVSYTTEAATISMSGWQYRCVATNSGGSATSSAATLTVNKQTPTVTPPTAKTGLIYTGAAQELVSAGSTTGGTLQYSTDNSTWGTSVPTGTDAKDYTVYYKVVGNDNYSDAAAQSVLVTIGRKSITGTISITGTATMGETLTASNSASGETVSYQWYRGDTAISGAAGSTYTLAAADVGQTIKVTATGTGNYIGTAASSPTAAVGKAAPTVSQWPTASAITYGQSLNDSTLTGGTASVAGTFTWTSPGTRPAVSDSGTTQYDVTFTPSGAGYSTVTGGKVTLTVNKATPTPTVPSGLTATYGQTLADVTLPTGWAWDNASTASVGNVGSNNFSATFTPADPVNYNTVTQNLAVTVGKATPTVRVAVSLSGSAGAREAALTVTVTGVTNGAAPTGTVTLTGSNSLNQSLTLANGTADYSWTGLADGDYAVTAAYGGDSNYGTASGTKTFNTSKQEQATFTISPVGNKTYGDPAFTLSASGGSGTGAVTFTSSDPSVISILGNTATILKAGGPVTITAAKAEDENYNAASDTLNVTVAKKMVVFKANDKTVQQGGTMPTFDYAPVTLAQGDSIATPPTAACTATDTNTTGTFPITLSGAVLTNGDSYEISYQSGTLTVTAQSTYTVTVSGGTGGGSYAEGDTVTITATVPTGQRFTGWTVNAGGVILANASSATTTFTMPAGNVTVTANFQSNSGGGSSDGGSSGGGGGSSYTPPTYPPTGNRPSEGGGAATISPSRPEQGDTVTVTPKPDQGYEVDKITVTDQNGKPVEVTVKPDGTYTFTQPAGKVKIKITYKPVQSVETPWNNPFTDVSEGDWYYEAVRFVHERGLMNGYGDGRFRPNDNFSRAQLAQVLFNKEGRPVVNYPLTFSDVAGDAWYTEAIRWATSQGIVGGYSNGTFGPNDPITREQLAVILWRYSGRPAATNMELHFNDESEISGFALEAMCWAVENGILNGYGDGRLGPQGHATRAQVAQMLKNFFEKG